MRVVCLTPPWGEPVGSRSTNREGDAALDHCDPGDLMQRVASDTTLLLDVTTHGLVGAITGTLALAATLTVMGLLDLVLLAVTIGVLGMAATVIGIVVPRISRRRRQYRGPGRADRVSHCARLGGAQVASGAVAVGTLVAFLLYIYHLMPAINQVTSAVSDYQVGAVAIARIHEVEALPIEQSCPRPRPACPPPRERVPSG
jgi:ATP-binding cassette subfamily C protein